MTAARCRLATPAAALSPQTYPRSFLTICGTRTPSVRARHVAATLAAVWETGRTASTVGLRNCPRPAKRCLRTSRRASERPKGQPCPNQKRVSLFTPHHARPFGPLTFCMAVAEIEEASIRGKGRGGEKAHQSRKECEARRREIVQQTERLMASRMNFSNKRSISICSCARTTTSLPALKR